LTIGAACGKADHTLDRRIIRQGKNGIPIGRRIGSDGIGYGHLFRGAEQEGQRGQFGRYLVACVSALMIRLRIQIDADHLRLFPCNSAIDGEVLLQHLEQLGIDSIDFTQGIEAGEASHTLPCGDDSPGQRTADAGYFFQIVDRRVIKLNLVGHGDFSFLLPNPKPETRHVKSA